ncbi:MAG: YeeE/YedE family protein [Lewinella sp.]|nr:YeeE/YedE family protein [Lewinella sp.]
MENINRHQGYINPYLGGVLLGLLLLATFYVTGRGLGASGAIKNSVAATVYVLEPETAQQEKYIGQFITDDEHPLSTWLVFEVVGVIIGAFLSGSLAGRNRWRVEHSPKITSRKRIIFALAGGFLFGIGSQLARGCTSGAALSGSAALATSGFLTMICIFGGAYIFAFFFRKLWI